MPETIIYRIENWSPALITAFIRLLSGHHATFQNMGEGFFEITYDTSGLDQIIADARNNSIPLKKMTTIEE